MLAIDSIDVWTKLKRRVAVLLQSSKTWYISVIDVCVHAEVNGYVIVKIRLKGV